MRDPRHDILFEPVDIGPKRLMNRFFQVPHTNGFGTDRARSQASFRSTRAAGGWAAVCDGITAISPEADRASPPLGRLWDDDDVRNLSHVCEKVHEQKALFGLELFYPGPHADSIHRSVPGVPSAIPSEVHPTRYGRFLDENGIAQLQRAYTDAAVRARDAGVDIIYVYGSHGYLPLQFLSPFYNKRTDQYGGALAHRARFWLETLAMVREAVGRDCAIAVRLAVDALGANGVTIDESLAFVRLADDLTDLWDLNVGNNAEGWHDMAPSRLSKSGWQLDWTGRFRGVTAKPIVGTGRLTDPDQMADIIRAGHWDLIGAARPAIADPYLPAKVRDGRYDEIRECIGCNYCISRNRLVGQIECTQNPTAGEEYRLGWNPEEPPRATTPDLPVLIVGAGAAGLECAATLARRGYQMIHLVDAADAVGGYAATLAGLPDLQEWRRLIDWRIAQLDRYGTVEVILHNELTAAGILSYGAAAIVIATGARWTTGAPSPFTHRPIDGHALPHVLTPLRALATEDWAAGENVLVYDCEGYALGVGVAQHLAARGCAVRYVTPMPVVAPSLDPTLEGTVTRRRLAELNVSTLTGHQLETINESACTLTGRAGRTTVPADRVVLLTSRVPDRTYQEVAAGDAPADLRQLLAAGDCVAPRHLAECVYDGHFAARVLEVPKSNWPTPKRERAVVT